ncbi:BTB/POZ domain-containing protein KCTD9 [Nilaparvata lugens]|uniref:BTB/POZ domain-containing protein KCTD9 n=1 Tax=Nilaparvata lugens TaxID=108931 RepID=UPI000B97D196|nr:BTB/POZ domain-containing protein KCTD9 [Nilaparvata lugens]
MKRVIVFRNGTDVDGKVILVTHSLDELLNTATNKFGIVARRLFTPQGGEIDDLKLLRDDDILYVSGGEGFIPVGPIRGPVRTNELSPPKASNGLSDWVTLNVGGKYFTTSRSTLSTKEPNSMLARMFAESDYGYNMTPSNVDSNGAYLIDRSSTYFEPILNYLRNGQLIYDTNVNPEGILEEARFFGVESLVPQLENIIQSSQRSRDNLPLTRRDVINALIQSPLSSDLRFQGVNLAGADLSRLDLRNINFKFACLHGCRMVGTNLSWCSLERADLSHAQMEGAQLLGVKMLCANLEGANMRGCNFEDPSGSRTNMEGVNLKGANLEGSNMAGVNLRVSTLKNANLQNCDLRAAVLAGADLENCNLSGSDLHEANLRGANLKDAAFELMLTPLHMSQTIR